MTDPDLIHKDLIAALPRLRSALAQLDKAQRVTAQEMLWQVGPSEHAYAVRSGEQCPLCGRRRPKLRGPK